MPELIRWCQQTAGDDFDGITISGGEPFDQPAGLDFDLLCYSGYPLKTLQKKHAGLLKRLDAVIPEPYVDGRPLGPVWRGSDNQTLVPLSERGQRRYAAAIDQPVGPDEKRMQIAVESGRIWMIGIPDRGDMEKVEALCQSRGLTLEQVSWLR